MKMKDLLDRQKRIHAELKNIADGPAGVDGDLSAEQESRAAVLQEDMAKVKRQIDLQADVDECERRMSGTPVNGDRQLDRELRNFSLTRMIQSRLGANVDAGREREISQELERMEGRSSEGFLMPYSFFEKRAPITSASAGELIGTDHLGGQFIDILREKNPLNSLGVRAISGLQGNVEIPRLDESTSVNWFGENSDISETEAGFSKITLTPKHVGALTSYSRNMLLQSSPGIDDILRSDLAQVLALEVARATLNGAGGVEPTGILNTAGISKVTLPTDPMQYPTELADALFLADVDNVSFVVNSGSKKGIDNLLTTDGLPIGSGVYFRGYPHKFTTLVPAANKMIAGNFADVITGTWSSVEVLINPFMESAYRKGNIAMRIILTMDVAIRHPQAFATFGA